MTGVEWGQAVRPSVKDLISAVNELESYTDIEHEVTGTFLEREAANGLGGLSGDAEVQEIKGNTVVWNSIFGLSSNATKSAGLDVTYNDGYVTLDYSNVTSGTYVGLYRNTSNIKIIEGHKYLSRFYARKNTTNAAIALIGGGSQSATIGTSLSVALSSGDEWVRASAIRTPATSYVGTTVQPTIGAINGRSGTVDIRDVLLIDLTEMYGAGNEPTSVDEFEAQYGKNEFPYISTPYMLSSIIAGIEGASSCEFPAQTLRGIGTYWHDVMTENEIQRNIGVGTIASHGTVVSGNQKYCSLQVSGVDSWSSASAQPANGGWVVSILGLTKSDTPSNSLRIGRTWNALYAYAPLDADDSVFDSLIGMEVYYLKANPTTEPFAQPLDLTYAVQTGGTESWITPTGTQPTSSAPTATISYKMQYEYELITEKSFDNFCTALGTALNLDIEKEWNDETKEWEFTITSTRSNLNAIDISEREELYSIDDERDILESNILEPIKEVDENEQR